MKGHSAGPVVTETDRVRRVYDRLAPRYDRLIALAERLLFAGGRQWACAEARGDLLEVAVGTGGNLAFYPRGVHLTGIDVSEGMLARVAARARTLALDPPVDLQVGDAQHLEFPDASFDTVIATLALCSIPDHDAAVAEMARVLRPGGQLRLLEHVASPRLPIRVLQQMLDPLAVRFQGDHLLRRPELPVRAAGLEIDHMHRSKAGIVLMLTARKPSRAAPSPRTPTDRAGGADDRSTTDPR